MPVIYLNGKFVEHQEAALDPLDRGVLLGDGIFETIRCEGGQLLFHVAHFARLGRNARLMEIPWNMNPEELLQVCQQALDANGLDRARLRITVTRGELGASSEIGSGNTAPTMIIHTAQIDQRHLDDQRVHGWRGRMISFPINHRSPLAEVKSTSYQEHLLARHFAKRDGFDEGIFLNNDGLLAEGAMSNLFIVKGDAVLTPPVEDGAMPGIVRLKLGIMCGRLGINYREESLTLEDLMNADEAFLTSSIIEVMPLVQIDRDKIAHGRPGPVTERLHMEHRRDVQSYIASLKTG